MGIFRLILIFTIVLGHMRAAGMVPDDILPGINPSSYGGALRIHSFFIIAGFFYDMVLQEKITGKGQAWRFWFSRWLRLMPCYYLILLLCLACSLMPPYLGLKPLALTGGMIEVINRGYNADGNLYILANAFAFVPYLFTPMVPTQPLSLQYLVVVQAWSFSIEFFFMAIAPLALCVRRHYWLWMAMLGFWGVWCYLHGEFRNHVLAESIYFMLGSLGYRTYRLYLRHARRQWAINGVALVLLVVGTYVLLTFDTLAETYGKPQTYLVGIVLFTIMIPLLFNLSRVFPAERALGDFAYPIYLNHGLMIIWVRNFELDPQILWWLTPITCLIMGLPMLYFIDKPINRWKERYFLHLSKREKERAEAAHCLLPG